MTINTTKAPEVIVAFYQAFVKGDLSLCDEAVSIDWENHPREPGGGSGVEAFKHAVTMYRSALDNLDIEFEQVIVDGNNVALRIRITGKTTGKLLNLVEAIQPEVAGKTISFECHDFHTIRDGRIVETHHIEHWLSIFHQLQIVY